MFSPCALYTGRNIHHIKLVVFPLFLRKTVWLLWRGTIRGLALQRVAAVSSEGSDSTDRRPPGAGLLLHQHDTKVRSKRRSEQHSLHGTYIPFGSALKFSKSVNLAKNLPNWIYMACRGEERNTDFVLQGCIYKMADDLKHHLILLGAIGLGICVIQVFGMILSCCLYVKLKDVLDWQKPADPIVELMDPLPDNISLIYGYDDQTIWAQILARGEERGSCYRIDFTVNIVFNRIRTSRCDRAMN